MTMAMRTSSRIARIKGLALSAFVKVGAREPAVKGVQACHSFALGAFISVIILQVLPRLDSLRTTSRLEMLLEGSFLAAVNSILLALCAFWFWLYFADRNAETVRVRPLFIAQSLDVRLALPDIHSSQLILLVLPLMLAAFVALVAALSAQVGFLAMLLSNLRPEQLLQDAGTDCAGFGATAHRAFLAIFSTVLGSDHACMKLSSATSLGAYLSGTVWAARSVLAAVAFGVFVQFGTVIVRRHRT